MTLRPLTGATLALALLAGAAPAADRQALFLELNPELAAELRSIDIRGYYPLNVGRTWSYTDSIAGKDIVLKVAEHTSHGGTPVAKVVDETEAGTYDLVTTSGALKLVLRQDSNGTLDWSADPVPFSQGPTVQLGDQYQATPTSYTNPVTGGNFQWTVRIRKIEDVTVPAGSFSGCLRIDVKTVDTASGAGVANFKMWFAPGVGLVKRAGRFIAKTFKQELTSYSS